MSTQSDKNEDLKAFLKTIKTQKLVYRTINGRTYVGHIIGRTAPVKPKSDLKPGEQT
jgi:hypothetical protein